MRHKSVSSKLSSSFQLGSFCRESTSKNLIFNNLSTVLIRARTRRRNSNPGRVENFRGRAPGGWVGRLTRASPAHPGRVGWVGCFLEARSGLGLSCRGLVFAWRLGSGPTGSWPQSIAPLYHCTPALLCYYTIVLLLLYYCAVTVHCYSFMLPCVTLSCSYNCYAQTP
jgi:hypothetical protein